MQDVDSIWRGSEEKEEKAGERGGTEEQTERKERGKKIIETSASHFEHK